ncbi:MAG: DUF5658 family protein [Chitinophagales bacterium]
MGEFYVLLGIVIFLNLFDLASTLSWYRAAGSDIEYNPIMQWFFSLHPLAAIAYKLLVIAAFVWVMKACANRNFRLAYGGTLLTVVVYTGLLFWHVIGPFLYHI